MEDKYDFSAEYLNNLISAVKGTTSLEMPVTSERNVLIGLQYVITTLEEQEQVFLHKRYLERKSLEEVSRYFEISLESVIEREKKILNKLRQPTRWGYIQYGVEGYLKKRIMETNNSAYHMGYLNGYKKGLEDGRDGYFPGEISENILDLPIESVGFSTRVYNSLIRANYERIRDIVSLSESRILALRNMGIKGAREVASKLQEYGIRNTAWDKFLI